MSVSDRAQAVAQLQARGLFPIELVATDVSPPRARLSAHDLAVGLRNLATLLDSQLPLARALAAFDEVAPPAWAPALPTLRERIRQGDALSVALERCELDVPAVIVGIIHAGERGSGVPEAVVRAADIAESSARLRASIRGALAYPAVLGVTGMLSLVVIVGVVMPRFAEIVSDVGAALPPLARMTLAISDIARIWLPPVTVAALLAGLSVARLLRDPSRREWWHRWLAEVPLVGGMRLAAASSRTCAALGALLGSGVPIAPALQHAARAAGDAWFARRLAAARERVIAGAPLSAALDDESAVTPTARRLIRAGEESGRLPAMLQRASELDATQLATRLNTAVRLIEPTLIVAFAGIVALVAAALLQAVYAVRPG